MHRRAAIGFVFAALAIAAILAVLVVLQGGSVANAASAPSERYVVLAWNDLGMHCYNPQFRDLAVLPPYNNLYAQVLRVADPPELVTSGITVTFQFTDNTHSAGKTDFWDISPYRGVQNAQWLFKLPNPLPADVGLTGVGLAGEMELSGDHFVAEGIPLTEYRDSAPSVAYPYQTATVIVWDAASGAELARTVTVAPVSTEMHCDSCHYDNGPGNDDWATGVVDQNILSLHDEENQGDYPPGHEGALMGRRPVLCAECHSSNALGAPGVGDIPSFSKAMHSQHKERVPQDMTGCYLCHPGPQTECLRDVMSSQFAMDCLDCHGTMAEVAQNPNPWLNEPRCDSAACHGDAFQQDKPLYRQSREHGGLFCEGCHDSTHAVAPSRQRNDGLKFLAWQGHAGPLDSCTVCHATLPTGGGPHGMDPRQHSFVYLPLVLRTK